MSRWASLTHHPVLHVTMSKCIYISLHSGPIHSSESWVAVVQVPGNKVPFTLLLSISSSQSCLREEKFSEFIAGELRLKTSETTVLRAQSFNYRVKMCTRLWSLCAHLHAWTSPMVTFCHLERVEEGDILSWSNRCDLNKSMLPPPDIHSTHPSLPWWVTNAEFSASLDSKMLEVRDLVDCVIVIALHLVLRTHGRCSLNLRRLSIWMNVYEEYPSPVVDSIQI